MANRWRAHKGANGEIDSYEKSVSRDRVLCITRTAIILPDEAGAMAYIRNDNGNCEWAGRMFGSVAAAKRWAEAKL